MYITKDKRKHIKDKHIENSGIHYTANLTANNMLFFIKDKLSKMILDFRTGRFCFSLSEVPSEIEDEGDWAVRIITVTILFYNFKDLV